MWYPLQRAKKFETLPPDHQRRIFAEHASLGKRYGAGGHANDVRLACHGLDKNDNDFIVGLLGPKLHPFSAVVQEMRKTEQTSQYLDSLGPFFVGRAAWQAQAVNDRPADYDALLVVSFGGPEGPADVDSFLDNVFRGLRVPPETKEHIAKRYEQVGGVSPINAHTRAFIKALQLELDAHGPALPIYWGNRNWHPLLADTVAQMAHAGVRRALAFVTSTFSSYSGCRRYREDLFEAARALPNAPLFDKLRVPYNHPGFIAAMSDRVDRGARYAAAREAQRRARAVHGAQPAARRWRAGANTKRSSPRAARSSAMRSSFRAGGSSIRATTRRTAASLGSGPDIRDALREAKAEGIKAVVVAPIGFVCDHMEVVMDLDVDAAAVARELGLDDGSRRHRRHAPRLRGDGARADRRAPRTDRAAPRARHARPEPRPLPGRLLPARVDRAR